MTHGIAPLVSVISQLLRPDPRLVEFVRFIQGVSVNRPSVVAQPSVVLVNLVVVAIGILLSGFPPPTRPY